MVMQVREDNRVFVNGIERTCMEERESVMYKMKIQLYFNWNNYHLFLISILIKYLLVIISKS